MPLISAVTRCYFYKEIDLFAKMSGGETFSKLDFHMLTTNWYHVDNTQQSYNKRLWSSGRVEIQIYPLWRMDRTILYSKEWKNNGY